MQLSRTAVPYLAATYISRALEFISVVCGAVIKVDVLKLADGLKPLIPLVQRAQGYALFLAPFLLISVPFLRYVRGKVIDPKILSDIHDLLNQIRTETFANEQSIHAQHHRVTLFRFQKWQWCAFRKLWGGWLVPFERSGHLTRRTTAIFAAPDDGEMCEGIAGVTWSRQKRVYAFDLPNLRDPNICDDDIKKYSESTFIDAPNLKRRSPHSRAFMGIPVEVNGKPWGVVVVDSANTIIRKNTANRVFDHVAPSLAKHLARIK